MQEFSAGSVASHKYGGNKKTPGTQLDTSQFDLLSKDAHSSSCVFSSAFSSDQADQVSCVGRYNPVTILSFPHTLLTTPQRFSSVRSDALKKGI